MWSIFIYGGCSGGGGSLVGCGCGCGGSGGGGGVKEEEACTRFGDLIQFKRWRWRADIGSSAARERSSVAERGQDGGK